MTKQNGRRDGRLITHTEHPSMAKHADGVCPKTGGLMFNNEQNMKAFYERVHDQTGRVVRVNPDGGIPRGAEMERLRESDRVRARAESEARRRSRRR